MSKPVTERVPAPPELIARAEELIRAHPECFWFRHPEARITFRDDVELVVRRLRQHGDSEAWREAQALRKCL